MESDTRHREQIRERMEAPVPSPMSQDSPRQTGPDPRQAPEVFRLCPVQVHAQAEQALLPGGHPLDGSLPAAAAYQGARPQSARTAEATSESREPLPERLPGADHDPSHLHGCWTSLQILGRGPQSAPANQDRQDEESRCQESNGPPGPPAAFRLTRHHGIHAIPPLAVLVLGHDSRMLRSPYGRQP